MFFLKYDSNTGLPLEVTYHEYPSFMQDKYIVIDNDLAALLIMDIRQYRVTKKGEIVKLTDNEYNYYVSREMITIRNQLLASTDYAILRYTEITDEKEKNEYLTKDELYELIRYRDALRAMFDDISIFNFYKIDWPMISIELKNKLSVPTADDLVQRW